MGLRSATQRGVRIGRRALQRRALHRGSGGRREETSDAAVAARTGARGAERGGDPGARARQQRRRQARVLDPRGRGGRGRGRGEEEEGLGPAEPDDYFLFQRSSGGKLPSTGDFTRAVRQAQAVRAASAGSTATDEPWALEGPTNVGGRLTDLAIDPADPDTVYVAAATGGVWKTTDGGVTLQQAWPDDAAQAIGAITIGAEGRIWAGAGELNPGGGSITFGGNGVYRSDDGGATWKRRGLEDSGTTGRIVAHPTDPDTVYVAAGGSLFNAGGERGIYRSTNGGASWQRVLAPETPFSGGADLVMDPTDSDRLYAVMWDHRREPDVRTYGGVGSGLFRTDDGGDTWKRLQNVLTFTPGNANGPADESGLASDETLGRIGVAVAPSDPNRVYVITTHTFGQDKGFYVSNDAGESFNTAARPGSQGGFGWWFGRDLGRPGEQGPPVRGRREPAPVVRRRPDVGQLGRRARRPARAAMGRRGGQPRVPGQRRRALPLGHQRRHEHLDEGDPRAVHAALPGRGGRDRPVAADRRYAGQRLHPLRAQHARTVGRLRLRRRRVRADRPDRRADLLRLLAVRRLPPLRRAQRHAHQQQHPGRHRRRSGSTGTPRW